MEELPKIRLGSSDLFVSKLALGCFAFAGDHWQATDVHRTVWGAQPEEASFAAVRAALDAGVNLFDNAEQYGDGYAEEVLGRALAAAAVPREQVVVATKANAENLAPDRLATALERSLKRLQMNHVDLYQIHWPSRSAVKSPAYPDRPLDAEVPLADTLAELARLKAQGKIRAVGVCNFGPEDLQAAHAAFPGLVVSNQLSYSLLSRAPEDAVLAEAERCGVSLLAWSPLQQGLLTGKFRTADQVPAARQRTRHFSGARPLQRHNEAGHEQLVFDTINGVRQVSERLARPMAEVSLAWLLSRRGVASVLVGARDAEQMHSNIRAAHVRLTPEEIAELDAVTLSLKQSMGSNLDPYENAQNSRIR